MTRVIDISATIHVQITESGGADPTVYNYTVWSDNIAWSEVECYVVTGIYLPCSSLAPPPSPLKFWSWHIILCRCCQLPEQPHCTCSHTLHHLSTLFLSWHWSHTNNSLDAPPYMMYPIQVHESYMPSSVKHMFGSITSRWAHCRSCILCKTNTTCSTRSPIKTFCCITSA